MEETEPRMLPRQQKDPFPYQLRSPHVYGRSVKSTPNYIVYRKATERLSTYMIEGIQPNYSTHSYSMCIIYFSSFTFWMSNNVCAHVLLPSRLYTIGDIPLPVTCGAMVLSCTRYGVWDTNHLRDTQIIRWGGCMMALWPNILWLLYSSYMVWVWGYFRSLLHSYLIVMKNIFLAKWFGNEAIQERIRMGG